ncbi:Glucanosyltransferase [Teratosphaeria destructans]|uniref:1,3-beta-glucanosyltransferase n=1 Tax=Teratosphaeria destructans TaxID=418781 RepID=A0A9W7SKI2_9PEZI|nr:Glucanosyltransferase [Teratosphaeria destructans]
MKGFASLAALTATFVSAALADVDPIVIKGSKFFYKTNGTQFFIRGVAYQQDYTGNGTTTDSTGGYTDPLQNIDNLKRDIPYLTQLRTNVIRTYAIDPTVDHTEAMSLLADAGIYVISDLSSPSESIDRSDPAWNDELYARYTSVVDNMANFTNTLGFFAGNEVSNAPNNTDASAFVKAAVRDMKAYIKEKNYRTIGVGYATNDDASIRVNMADYFNCGDQSDAIDFWGYNIYSWCGDSSYTESGYDVRTQEFSNYSVPAFFAEYGCNSVQPRPFTEVQALYGDEMSPVWSGGIVYMYYQEANDYGLVSVDGNTVSTLSDFDNYSRQIANITPSSVAMSAYSPSNSPAACPGTGSSWAAVATPLPPTPNQELCSCMYDTLSCVVSSSTNSSGYGTLFGEVCGYGDEICAGFAANATTGSYGAYGMCNSTEQLALAFNNYYLKQSSQASACDFGGSATIKPSSTGGSACSSLIKEAGGTAGTGTVTSAPSGTGAGAASSGSSSSSKGAAAGSPVPSYSSVLPMVMIATLAMVSGMGMILL